MDFSKFFKTMTKEAVHTALLTAPDGSDCEIAYFSECSPSAASKKANYHLYKLTTVQCKVGLDYSTLPEVIERHKAEDYKPRKDSFETLIKGKMYFNNNEGKLYASWFYPTSPTTFYIVDKDGDSYMTADLTEEEKAITIPSYWAKRNNPLGNVFRRVRIDNILSFRVKG